MYGQDLTEVEDGLLPVGVFCVWTGRESDWLVAGCEVDIEPSDQCMDKIVATAVESELLGEGEVSGRAGVEVEGQDGGGVGDNGFDFDGIDERLGKGGVLERGVIEAVDVVPDC